MTCFNQLGMQFHVVGITTSIGKHMMNWLVIRLAELDDNLALERYVKDSHNSDLSDAG